MTLVPVSSSSSPLRTRRRRGVLDRLPGWMVGTAALSWAYLLAARGGYWRAHPTLGAAGRTTGRATEGATSGTARRVTSRAAGGMARESAGRVDAGVPEGTRPGEGRGPATAPPPAVVAIVPARNEAELLAGTLARLARHAPAGLLRIVVVDDASTDSTLDVAEGAETGSVPVTVVRSAPLPTGWTGKVWALEQGRRAIEQHCRELEHDRRASEQDRREIGAPPTSGPHHGRQAAVDATAPTWLWLVDADIAVGEGVLSRLRAEAEGADLDLASVLARLRVEHPAERLLVPAFVYFFQLLYPFRWVGRPGARTAAAAGGCVLIRWEVLERLGGFGPISGARIDDVALAKLVRARGRDGSGSRPGRLWLGFDEGVESRRAYEGVGPLWDMVARNAFTQLDESRSLVALTVVGLLATFVAPFVLSGAALGSRLRVQRPAAPRDRRRGLLSPTLVALATTTSGAAVLSYLPTVQRCGLPRRWALTLPLASTLYAGMTVDSARRARAGLTWRGRRLGDGIG